MDTPDLLENDLEAAEWGYQKLISSMKSPTFASG